MTTALSSTVPVTVAAQHRIYSAATAINTLAGIVADIGSARATAVIYGVISYGSVTIVPATLTLDLSNGMIDCNNIAAAVTITGPIIAPSNKQIFVNCTHASGSIVLSSNVFVGEVTPQMWGAAFDNTTDDRLPFLMALLAGAGRTVRIAGGTARLTNTLNISANTTVLFENVTLNFTNAAAGGDVNIGGSNITLVGKNARINYASIQCIYASGTSINGLVVEGLTLAPAIAMTGHGIQINHAGTANNILIHNNTLISPRTGILFNSTPTEMRNIIIRNNTLTGVYGDGIEINRVSPGAIATNVLIDGNSVAMDPTGSGTGTSGFALAIACTEYATITNNIIPLARTEGIHVEGGVSGPSKYTLISHNQMLTLLNGIVVLYDGTEVIISDNIVRRSGSGTAYGIYFPDVAGSYANRSILNNLIDAGTGVFTIGILLGGGGDVGPIIAGNRIIGCNTAVSVTSAIKYANAILNNVFATAGIGIQATSGGIVGKNTYAAVSTPVTSFNAKIIMRGWINAFSVAYVNGVVNNRTLFPLGQKASGTIRTQWIEAGTNHTTRVSQISWDGATLTETNTFVFNGGGVFGNGSFTASAGVLQATMTTTGNVTGNVYVEFEGDVVLP
jgi:hypothetical protein